MTTITDAGFVEMRLSKAMGVTTGQDDPCYVVVLDGVSQDRHLPIMIGSVEALTLSASLAGREFARPMSPQFAVGLLNALGGRVLRSGLTGWYQQARGLPTAPLWTWQAPRVSNRWMPGPATR